MQKEQQNEELLNEFLKGGDGGAIKKLKKFRELMVRYDCAIREVRTKFEVLNEELSFRTSRSKMILLLLK